MGKLGGRLFILVGALSLWGSDGLAYESLYKDENCTIGRTSGAPVHTTCVVRMSMSQGVGLYVIKTPDEKVFRVENSERARDQWQVNRQPAKATYDHVY